MLYLASGSPRRKELLQLVLSDFQILSAQIDETPFDNESPIEFVQRMALEKAHAGLKLVMDRDGLNWVLGSDTVVVSQGRILGKPKDNDDFLQMMRSLSGKEHQVLTAIALVSEEKCYTELVTTKVHFRDISEAEMQRYWQSGEPSDKAGGYGIQAGAGKFVTYIEGSYFAVVGLPLYETEQLLIKAKII